MDRKQAEALVSELASALGIPELALDEQGAATLGIGEEQIVVSLGYHPSAGAIDLMVCLDEIVPTSGQLMTLLQANFGWVATEGAAFACVPGSGAVVLQSRCTAAELHTGGLAHQIESLIEMAQTWTRMLKQEAAVKAPSPDSPGPLGAVASGMVRL